MLTGFPVRIVFTDYDEISVKKSVEKLKKS